MGSYRVVARSCSNQDAISSLHINYVIISFIGWFHRRRAAPHFHMSSTLSFPSRVNAQSYCSILFLYIINSANDIYIYIFMGTLAGTFIFCWNIPCFPARFFLKNLHPMNNGQVCMWMPLTFAPVLLRCECISFKYFTWLEGWNFLKMDCSLMKVQS